MLDLQAFVNNFRLIIYLLYNYKDIESWNGVV